MDHFFPDLYERLGAISELRKRPFYSIEEILLGALGMFLLKEGSRNALNNERQERRFLKNYRKVFKVRLPHLDTVDAALRLLAPEELEGLKASLLSGLLAKKVFAQHRFLGKYYRIVVDGVHVLNVPAGHCPHCLHRTSKKGKVSCFHNVLEAKLVTENGFSISLESEWIENPEGEYDKQDCERRAFERLAIKLKKRFARLPICIVADALYPYQTFFQICQQNSWAWMVTFKDGNLPSVWQEVLSLKKLSPQNHRQEILRHPAGNLQRDYCWVNEIAYQSYRLHWFECLEHSADKTTRFVYLSSETIDYFNVLEATENGRLRWKIENEGFNTQKNLGYGLCHKYSRVSFQAMKNYYQCLQIAHMINQLFELGSLGKPLAEGKRTFKHLWKKMLGQMRECKLKRKALDAWLNQAIQIRFT